MIKTIAFVFMTFFIAVPSKAQNLGKLQPFQATYLKGESFDFKNLSGKVVLINFWGIWCPPCVEELPYLQNVYEKYKDNPSVKILAIHCTIGKSRKEVLNWVKKRNLSLEYFIYDDNISIRNSISSGGIPRNYIINRKGVIVKEIDDRPHDTFVQRVSNAINKLLEK